MTATLTTAEVRRAATTNLDLPLTQYKKLENGFDAWLESVKAEARVEGAKKALAALSPATPKSTQAPKKETRDAKIEVPLKDESPESTVDASPLIASQELLPPSRPKKRQRSRNRKRSQVKDSGSCIE